MTQTHADTRNLPLADARARTYPPETIPSPRRLYVRLHEAFCLLAYAAAAIAVVTLLGRLVARKLAAHFGARSISAARLALKEVGEPRRSPDSSTTARLRCRELLRKRAERCARVNARERRVHLAGPLALIGDRGELVPARSLGCVCGEAASSSTTRRLTLAA